MNSRRKLTYNTISSAVYHIVLLICGFILPRVILEVYGSNTNGLINSLQQFLGVISFMDMGVMAVMQSALYKPLAENDTDEVSRIMVSGQKFYTLIGLAMASYAIVLALVYPLFEKSFTYSFEASLTIVLSISLLAQYLFGIVNRTLLLADQKGYVIYSLQTLAIIFTTVLGVVFAKNGFSIHVVKLVGAGSFLLQVFLVSLYIKKKYQINRKIRYTKEPISQKWNGIAQHIAAVVLGQTDVLVLTVFSKLDLVSVYSVYNLVLAGVKNLLFSMTNGIQSLMGEYIAKKEQKKLEELFSRFEWISHTVIAIVFSCTAALIIPFVKVYTKNIFDAEYIVPAFAFLITLAHAGHCIRLPYNLLILAAGHYRQTQSNYIVAAAMNVVISVVCVLKWGLVGVAIGTLVAMVYQTIWMAAYDSKHLIHRSMLCFAKNVLVDILVFSAVYLVSGLFSLSNTDYLSWARLAIKVLFVAVGISMIVNLVFYKNNMMSLVGKLIKGNMHEKNE
ncbi:MAG: polysaccharide biosynthesis C-terminal domain-containing protein [Lachnospiraceae bacterium]|nr:polysaccharide biosynthesis C-terminal domain-containing protein [Lachnospiraceae bacterium]